ncbi:pyrophosphatase [Vibrio sp. 10N.286.49.C2]|uniref:NUDIX domain-containing protein n=1 Tax=unclassified Vibrio TaxID=2614977 RepID=UPI000C83DF66|nr:MULTISPECIES: NUDIX domain-containing protein [unclassified Vibrio]PMH39608.1 pyrophosphatase [Vibrio sp. 10N.286.49.C2]PMH57773.1 pyrophosphatase [Vibrio sp. 10N.286.49.B1]PMH81402.1 pyrophosphatase [Vibrio sp. 10N.286.48.B7]
MKHRIRAAGIALNNDNILLLKVSDEHSGEYWIPPGGGLEGSDQSSKHALVREYKEETGLDVVVGPLLFVREFLETARDTYHVELFYQIESWSGSLGLHHLSGLNDESYIHAVQWVPLAELANIKTFPRDIVSQIVPMIKARRSSLHLGSFVQGDNDDVNRLD